MPTDQKIDYLEFPAADFAPVQAFYSSAFGWEFTSYGPDYIAFTDHAMNGGFYRSEQRSTSSTGAVLVVIYAIDIEAAVKKVISAGGQIAREIFSFPGGRRFHFLDPHGNELAVWSDT